MTRTAKAHWIGNLKEGKGTLTTQSGVLENSNYSFKTRFEEGEKGTNPEELLAAAHAGCFTMAVCAMLTEKGLIATSLDTEAILNMEGTSITSIHLNITAAVPGISLADFVAITKSAEKNCLISKVLSIPIGSEAHFLLDKQTPIKTKEMDTDKTDDVINPIETNLEKKPVEDELNNENSSTIKVHGGDNKEDASTLVQKQPEKKDGNNEPKNEKIESPKPEIENPTIETLVKEIE